MERPDSLRGNDRVLGPGEDQPPSLPSASVGQGGGRVNPEKKKHHTTAKVSDMYRTDDLTKS